MTAMDDDRDPPEIMALLSALNAGFATRLPARMSDLEAALQSCLDNPADTGRWIVLRRQLHSLAGSAGSFGFAEISRRARVLEQEVDAILAAGTASAPHADVAQALRAFMRWAVDEGRGAAA